MSQACEKNVLTDLEKENHFESIKRKRQVDKVRVTSVLTAGFLVALTVVRLGVFSPMSSSECSVLVSDRSELCWDEASSARDAAAKERAAGLDTEFSGYAVFQSKNR